MIKAYKTCHTKERGVLSVFEKSYEEKRKKNPILVYPGLGYTHKKLNFASNFFFKKCLFEYENQFALEKNTKNFCSRHQKKASHTISIYGNCMTSYFFFRKQKFKKTKFSVVAAQKTLKCFASS